MKPTSAVNVLRGDRVAIYCSFLAHTVSYEEIKRVRREDSLL